MNVFDYLKMGRKHIVVCTIIFFLAFSWQGCAGQKKVSEGDILKIPSRDGVTVSYSVYGDGDTVLMLIHGWSCDQTYWREQLNTFKKNYRVVTVDLGGHGKSTKGTRKQWTMPNFAADVIAVVKALDYEKLVLVGHSMGSMVVLEAAAQMETPPNGVVCVDYLIDSLRTLQEEQINASLQPFYADFENSMKGFVSTLFLENTDETLKNWITQDMANGDPEVAISAAKYLAVRDYGETFAALKSQNNKYIINSDKRPTDMGYYENLGFSISVIKDSHHFLMLNQPDAFNTLLQKVIEQAP